MRDQLITLAAQYATPAIYEWPEFVKARRADQLQHEQPLQAGRQIGNYAGQILKGDKTCRFAGVQSMTSTNWSINLKTAKALGLAIPPSLLATADEVIE